MPRRKAKQTKEQKIQMEKEAIRRRLIDILYGAQGEYSFGNDPNSEDFYLLELSIDVIGRFLGGIKHILPEEKHFLFEPRFFEDFDNLNTIADLLHDHDIRG